MLDELDDGARIGVWTALGVVALLLFGLLGGIVIQKAHARHAPGAGVSSGVLGAAAGSDQLVDVPLTGDLAGTIFFGSGQGTLPADAAASLASIKTAADAAPNRRVVLSGFHDATGDPAKNVELAKERAKSVREALKTAGLAPTRIVLRKPESTTGGGNPQEARRVEARLVP